MGMQALLLAQQGWRVNVYDSRARSGDAWEPYSVAHAQNVVLGRRAQLCLARAEALQQVTACLQDGIAHNLQHFTHLIAAM